jgi:hypothetical protein
VGKALTGRGQQVVTVGRTAGDIRADVADPEETARVFAKVGDLDAVASAAKLRANAAAALAEARRTGQTPHTAAQRLAQQRALAASRLRGQLPIGTIPESVS